VRDNAVLPVLFLANICSSLVWLTLLALDAFTFAGLPDVLKVDALTGAQHLLLFLKSLLVAGSWLCSYFALKHLPLSFAAPVRATGPMWTLFGALLILGERPSWLELLGVGITVASFISLSVVGAKEGIHFHKNH
jgi:drug/metabolite transporter (DMT)-like permease